MAIVSRGHPVPDLLRSDLQRWLRGQPSWESGLVLQLREASQANGFSNSTYRVEVQRPGEEPEALILRTPPVDTGLFSHYDLERQFAFMSYLASVPGLAMAGCRWLETDARALGQPFYLVDFVAGSAAPDQPNYVKSGWVIEAEASQRERLWWSTLEQMARLAQVEVRADFLARWDWPEPQKHRLVQHIEAWFAQAEWGQAQLPGATDDRLDRLRRWLLENKPGSDPVGVVWGDARLGNVLYRDFSPVALLDWEMAAIGDPMIDLSYFLFHVFLMELVHGDASSTQRLRGFASDTASLEWYSTRTGRLPDLHGYYWLFNAYRILCVWQCKAALMHREGVWTRQQALEARRAEILWPFIDRVLAGGTEAACGLRDAR